LLVRGYAFQLGPLPSTCGLSLVPSLTKIGKLLPETLDSARLAPLTILGATVPQLQYVTELDNGMLIENMPNTNFSNNFFSLEVVSGPIIIVVGNAQLTSLDGLQGLAADDVVGQMQILGKPRLQDISALENVLQCENGQPAVLDPKAVLGVIEVIPEEDNPNGTSCLISNVGQACQCISNSMCPPGTYYDGRLPPVFATVPAASP